MKRIISITILITTLALCLVTTVHHDNTLVEVKTKETKVNNVRPINVQPTIKTSTTIKSTKAKVNTNAIIKDYKKLIREIENSKNRKKLYLEYKSFIKKYSDIIDVPETIYDAFSKNEIKILQKIVEAEATAGDFNSKLNVANVIFNRLEDSEFPNNIEEVVFAKNQFSPVKDGRYDSVKITEDTKLAVECAFLFDDTTNGAIGFHSNNKTSTFNGWKYLFTDTLGHHFYK